MSLAPDDPRHGTANGYCNLRCRCAECREAWRVYFQDMAHRLGYYRPRAQMLAEDHPIVHGTEYRGYDRGCRCSDCREAARSGRAQRRAKAAQKVRA